MFRYIACSLLFSTIAIADECPKEDEPIQTIPYTKTIQCPKASIIIEGETNPPEYRECLGDIPSVKEAVFYTNQDNSRLPLPPVKSLYPKESNEIQSRVWVATHVKCKDDNTINILYWGGGNCFGCEQSVQYIFSQGEFKEAKLAKGSIDPDKASSQRHWMTSTSYRLTLNVWDKNSIGAFNVKYIVKTEPGRVFVAERHSNDDNSNSPAVTFPDDFQEETVFQGKRIRKKAIMDANSYSVSIYANDELVDSGTIAWKRDEDDNGQYIGQ